MKVYGVAPDKGAFTARALVLGNDGDSCYAGIVHSPDGLRKKAAEMLHISVEGLEVVAEFTFDSRGRVNRDDVSEEIFRVIVECLAANRLFTAIKELQDDDALEELVVFMQQTRHVPAPRLGS